MRLARHRALPLRPAAGRHRRLGLRSRMVLAFALGAALVSGALVLITYTVARHELLAQRTASSLRQTYVNARLVKQELGAPSAHLADVLSSLQGTGDTESFIYRHGLWYGTSVSSSGSSLPAALVRSVRTGHVAEQRVLRAGQSAVVVGVPLPVISLGAEATPHLVAKDQVPYGLLQPASPTTAVASPSENVTVYLEGPQHLATVSRIVPSPATPSGVLAALSAGPTSAEAAEDLRSPISTAAPMAVQSVDGGLVVVRLAAGFANLAGRDQIAAVAQLVYTMTAVPGIEAVEVHVGGRPASVPTANGSLTKAPVTRADYAAMAAP